MQCPLRNWRCIRVVPFIDPGDAAWRMRDLHLPVFNPTNGHGQIFGLDQQQLLDQGADPVWTRRSSGIPLNAQEAFWHPSTHPFTVQVSGCS